MGAGLLIQAKNTKRVLVLKRADYKNDPYKDYWDFAGGTSLNDDEPPLQTAYREAVEEIGPLPRNARVWEHFSSEMYTLYVTTVDKEWEITLSEEHTKYMWVEKETLPTLEIHPKDKRFLTKAYRCLL